MTMRRRLFLQRGIAGSVALGAALARAEQAGGQPVDRSGDGADEGSERDRQVMRELAAFTRRSFTTARPIPFGAFVVRPASGETIVRALNEVGPLLDPTAHGEVQAIRAACRQLKRGSLDGCTLYTTAEPCPMCMAAILWAGLDRVVFGATIADIARHLAQIHIATTIARSPVPSSARSATRSSTTPCSRRSTGCGESGASLRSRDAAEADDRAAQPAFPDLLASVVGFDLEDEMPAVDLGELGGDVEPLAHGSRAAVGDADLVADGGAVGPQERIGGVLRGPLHFEDHRWGGEDGRAAGVRGRHRLAHHHAPLGREPGPDP
jgi:tRNA(Arg) A34 adenosine deaminase TadA